MVEGPAGVTSDPGVSRSHLGPRGPAQQPGMLGAAPMPARRLPCGLRAVRLGSKRSSASRAGPAAARDSSLAASPSAAAAGLVKVTRAVRLPPNPPSQDGPARPGRSSPPPALVWPRRIPHLPQTIGDAAGTSRDVSGNRSRSQPQIQAVPGGGPNPRKRAGAPPTAEAQGGGRVGEVARYTSTAAQDPGRSAGSGPAPDDGGA